jgi:DNA-binding beta-propeller fold protein YncE
MRGNSETNVLPRGALIDNPFGIVRGPDGLIYFCEFGGQCVRRVNAMDMLEIVAGIPGRMGHEGDGKAATLASFNRPHEIRFDKKGDLYISDMSNQVIRKVDMETKIISTFAGVGPEKGFAGDGGPASKAKFSDPISIQFDPDGNLCVCDIGNHRVRKIDMKTGIITTVCGNGKKEATPDGAPFSPETPIFGPRAIEFDREGNGWLVLREGNAVYKIDRASGKMQRIAGNGKQGNTGNGGPAVAASLAGPKGIALDPAGTFAYLADTESHTIRVIDLKSGTIDVLVGTGRKGDGPDGPPRECSLARPHGVFVDRDGSLWIGDSENNRIRIFKR